MGYSYTPRVKHQFYSNTVVKWVFHLASMYDSSQRYKNASNSGYWSRVFGSLWPCYHKFVNARLWTANSVRCTQQQYMYTMHESVKHVLKAVGLHDNDILLMHVWNMLHTGVSFDTLAKFMVYAIYPSYMYTDIMQS